MQASRGFTRLEMREELPLDPIGAVEMYIRLLGHFWTGVLELPKLIVRDGVLTLERHVFIEDLVAAIARSLGVLCLDGVLAKGGDWQALDQIAAGRDLDDDRRVIECVAIQSLLLVCAGLGRDGLSFGKLDDETLKPECLLL